MSAYEKERLARIARNRALLQQLGLHREQTRMGAAAPPARPLPSNDCSHVWLCVQCERVLSDSTDERPSGLAADANWLAVRRARAWRGPPQSALAWQRELDVVCSVVCACGATLGEQLLAGGTSARPPVRESQ